MRTYIFRSENVLFTDNREACLSLAAKMQFPACSKSVATRPADDCSDRVASLTGRREVRVVRAGHARLLGPRDPRPLPKDELHNSGL